MVHEESICTCDCHFLLDVYHMMSCCSPCPVCHESYTGGPSAEGVAACAAEKRAGLERHLQNRETETVCYLISNQSERTLLYRLLGGVMGEIETFIGHLTCDPEIKAWLVELIAKEAGERL